MWSENGSRIVDPGDAATAINQSESKYQTRFFLDSAFLRLEHLKKVSCCAKMSEPFKRQATPSVVRPGDDGSQSCAGVIGFQIHPIFFMVHYS